MASPARTLAVLALAAVLFAASLWFKERALEERAGWQEQEDVRVALPAPEYLPALSMGYRELGASLLWVRALVHGGADRDEDAFGGDDLEPILDGLFALDPRFERAYRWGSTAVTIDGHSLSQRGLEASARYLELAIQEFPDDWEFHWRLGLRYWLDLEADTEEEERKLRERGAELLEAAMRMPDAPPHLADQVIALRTRLGQRDRALRELEQMIATAEDEATREVFLRRYRALEGDADLAGELERAGAALEEAWRRELPYAPLDLYVLLGDAPEPTFDLDALAAPPPAWDALGDLEAPEDALGLASPVGDIRRDDGAAADGDDADASDRAPTHSERGDPGDARQESGPDGEPNDDIDRTATE